MLFYFDLYATSIGITNVKRYPSSKCHNMK